MLFYCFDNILHKIIENQPGKNKGAVKVSNSVMYINNLQKF